jgi:nucleoside-triphosphatase THEP1
MFTITAMPNNLLVTGKSGIGKSTVLAKVAELLEPRVISGFLSPRNHDGVTDQGWKIVGFNGVTGIVAHPDIRGHQRMGSLGVDMELFDRCVGSENGTLSESDLVIIDEIGIFSDWSEIFRDYVTRAMNADVLVVAIVL